MSNTKRIIIAIVAVVVIAGGAIWYMMATSNKTTAPSAPDTSNENQDNANEEVAATITYDGSSFSLSTDTVAAGSTVKVVNNSDKELDFDSDPHPVHTDNPELNEGLIPARQSATFTLNTEGTWGFHNHLDANQRGSITVQ